MKGTANDKQEEVIHDKDKKKRKRNNKKNNKKTTNETDSRRKNTAKQEKVLHKQRHAPRLGYKMVKSKDTADILIKSSLKSRSTQSPPPPHPCLLFSNHNKLFNRGKYLFFQTL